MKRVIRTAEEKRLRKNELQRNRRSVRVRKPVPPEKLALYAARSKEKRRLFREDNPLPARIAKVKEPVIAKVIPEKRLPQSPKVTLLRKERKPKQQSDRMVIPTTPPTSEFTYIPELKMSVHLEKGQTIASVIAKYSSRPGNKIGKW